MGENIKNNDGSFTMAERLKQLRTERGLSHEKLRDELQKNYGASIDKSSLINYEIAQPNHSKAYANQGMQVRNLRILAQFYGVSADWLLGISDVRSPDTQIHGVMEYTGLSEDNVLALHLYSHQDEFSGKKNSENAPQIIQKIYSQAGKRQNAIRLSVETMNLLNNIIYVIATHPRGVSTHFAQYNDLTQKEIEYVKTHNPRSVLEIDEDLVKKVNAAGFDVMSFNVGAQWHLRTALEILEHFIKEHVVRETAEHSEKILFDLFTKPD